MLNSEEKLNFSFINFVRANSGKKFLLDAFEELSKEEISILVNFILLEKSFIEIADEMYYTVDSAITIYNNSVNKLKNILIMLYALEMNKK